MTQCIWDMAWVGRCGETALVGKDVCEKHVAQCRNCNSTATHDCDATVGPLVCGYPLCDDCGHDWDDKDGWALSHKFKDKDGSKTT